MSDDRSDERATGRGHGDRREQHQPPGHRRSRSAQDYDPERLKYFTRGADGGGNRSGRHGPRTIRPGGADAAPTGQQWPGGGPSSDPSWAPPESTRPPIPSTGPPPGSGSRMDTPFDAPPPNPVPPDPRGSRHPRAYDPVAPHDATGPYVDPGREDFDRRQRGERDGVAVAGVDPASAPSRRRPDPRSALPTRDRSPKRSAAAERRRKRKRVVIAAAVAFMVLLVGGIGYAGLRLAGQFGGPDNSDFSNTAGTSDVVVQIPPDSSLTAFGEILKENKVVASVGAFTTAADGKPISAGFYKLRTEIPASTAVSMLTDDNRVGRVVIPEGLQLDTKEGIDGKTTPGVFARVAEATSLTLNGQESGVTVEELAQAAATATPQELGVPSWATDAVTALAGDHRRIEGLIAPTLCEAIDPNLSPVQMLNYLISRSASLFAQWGLPESGTTSSNMTPYQTLVTASIVEREVNRADDYPKVARVVVNRLDDNQALQMDSTVNYTSAIQNIDVAGDDFTADTKWNTYQQKGLPPTPIGAVGQPALEASLNPPVGNWLYFVSIDQQGTTLFTDDFEQHKRNRQQACDNGVLQTNCG
ncbi:endolytic transglycosylase MltG [Williamsia muralis]|uniref:endolytic transglycosylase MltG n=1 Tax=Williamsia marianensis TaxID=85044 RepID=UPI003F5CCFCA